MADSRAVVLDTDVFSVLNVTRLPSEDLARRAGTWRATVADKAQAISFQTRAEVLGGAYLANWGIRRLAGLLAQLDRTPTIDEDDDVVDAYAKLLADAARIGHPLGNPAQHVGDRWIAACAIAKGVPLLTGNLRHFAGAPGLELL